MARGVGFGNGRCGGILGMRRRGVSRGEGGWGNGGGGGGVEGSGVRRAFQRTERELPDTGGLVVCNPFSSTCYKKEKKNCHHPSPQSPSTTTQCLNFHFFSTQN